RLKIQPFTLIGATTKAGNLSAPLRDRFGVLSRLENYTTDELKQIINRSAYILGTEIDEDASTELAKRSRGTPRIANRLLKRIRDFAEVYGKNKIDLEVCQKALNVMEIDSFGLDFTDKNLILTMIDRFGGRPVGLDTLASSTGEDANTIEDVYEPYLLQIGFIARTPRGRICLAKAYEHFNREMPDSIKTVIKELKADTTKSE
ncbi:MAG: Holliday junction branch migration DNA helicase RuvB, partial [Clostridia bacterium]|nr:Holliday junction branch migration DNA helicase RuvB [Clostridia bacterium]